MFVFLFNPLFNKSFSWPINVVAGLQFAFFFMIDASSNDCNFACMKLHDVLVSVMMIFTALEQKL
jgi:hypothetical protein